ncbi:MAG: 5-methyltetrahydropteroyltriglutamate--homocysteine S-methyltransferase [Alphaproteobacteria bacterium]|nr:5-methyltetrahydropteroyltriglutamate--homocysteine S-methyltransferase [Alphaproteobacteria bacterium]
MVLATNLGFPRIGAKRELKKALESYWAKEITEGELFKVGAELRGISWKMQKDAGIDHIPSNDFTYYDHVLDMATTVGAVPERYGWNEQGEVDLDTFFAMARGNAKTGAMEMTKWFDTNYHYIVPEFHQGMSFKLAGSKALRHFEEAKKLGIQTRPVLLGPVSFLLLGKMKGGGNALSLLDSLLPVYGEILGKLAAAGAEWVQVDEPCFVLDQPQSSRDALKRGYERLAKVSPKLKLLIATYFDELGDNLEAVFGLPVAGVHIDLKRAPQQLDAALKAARKDQVISLGVIDGRNVWRADLSAALPLIEKAVAAHGKDKIFVAPSCSLLHTPVDLDNEKTLDAELKSWMAFSKQKLAEVAALTKAANGQKDAVKAVFDASDKAAASRKTSPRIHDQAVKTRAAKVATEMLNRKHPFAQRLSAQRQSLNLPLFPTTTIGSFPQTTEIRNARADFKAGKIDEAQYKDFLKKEIAMCVKFQEETGIDVFVHGEAERNDMVEYFGEQMNGYTFTKYGWVQSYGSRYVKPPIIFGDISRPQPMTVEWSVYAQSLTKKPMKGMLTGPVTILQWSFVRDDQPRSETAKQLALALRDEVLDLEKAGIKVIQIDEPAVREGLPLRRKNWQSYLRWAVDAFRLSAAGVRDETQIHTHMCYAEFNDIIEAVAELDADVISIETSRSQMELLDAFVGFKYPNEIGPGVYDIHSPRVVPQGEMEALLKKAVAVLKPEQVWVNPDCGLKTRKWEETRLCLKNMVGAAKAMRAAIVAQTEGLRAVR